MFKSKTTDFPQVLKQDICTFEVYECQIETAHWVAIRMKGNETSLFWFHIHCCDFKELLRKSKDWSGLQRQAAAHHFRKVKAAGYITSQSREQTHPCLLPPPRSPSLLLSWNCCPRDGTAHNDLSFPTSIKYKDNPWQPCPWTNLL